MTTPKSEVRVMLSLKAAETIYEAMIDISVGNKTENQIIAQNRLLQAIRNAQSRLEPPDEEKQAIISQ